MWRDIVSPPKILSKRNSSIDAAAVVKESKLRPEQELFFLMSLGSVYESSGRDEIAISCYMKAITEI